MSDARFANPQWSIAIWIVIAVLAILFWLQHRQSSVLQRFMSAKMQARLVSRPPAVRRWLAIACLGLSAICVVIALMRPQYGLTYIKSPRVGAQIMFCLDVSKSMLAEDTAPNRLDRAKADIADMVSFLDGDQVGLIGFAGRATVLCPLTPDYGFFKLILDDANPSSVGRGGTRLEEPLRKALDGFRSESDVSRIVVLITDGEDHDSHPLDVAKEAVERGIRVIAIGFGDEAGSEIRITDPRTGIQTTVKDADGKLVVSRLDGELLRELALATEGVYIPAGTGNLDLRSIYDAHIEPLVRGEMQTEGRAVRRDAFQWAILAAIILLLLAVALASGGADFASGNLPAITKQAASLLFALLVAASPIAHADESVTEPESSTAAEASDPRETYNLGLQQLDQNLSEAEQLLSSARDQSGSDGEVRFRSTYNMGWVEVQRADEQLEAKPEEALKHLQTAAGWFRDAIRLRKDDVDARHNLEVVLRRILELRDQLAKRDEKDLAGQLDAVIESQRTLARQVRALVDQVSRSEDPNIADKYRSEFQQFAVKQRTLLSELQDVVEQASTEFDTLQGKPEEERTPEDNVRMAQLVGVLNYINQANQRIGQARSQLRRRQAFRAFRRASAGLNELKRARDQLRNPLQTLDGILADAYTTTRETTLKSLQNGLVASENDQANVPAWITQDYLSDSQTDIASRTDELTTRLAAGLENQDQPQGPDAEGPAEQPSEEQRALLDQLRDAMPYLQSGNEAMRRAKEKLLTPDYREASEAQVTGINALQEARERFADIRALIELAFATESELAGLLAVVTEPPSESEDQLPEQVSPDPAQVAEVVSTNQAKNIERMKRLQQKVASQLKSIESQPQDETATGNSAETSAEESPEQQQLLAATQLIELAIRQMDEVAKQAVQEPEQQKRKEKPPEDQATEGDAAEDDSSSDSDDEEKTLTDIPQPSPFAASRKSADQAVETLTDLRRLFFSVLEHLQDTARRQLQLNDETEQAAGEQAERSDDEAAPEDQQRSQQIQSTQEELAQMSEQIAGALQQQAEAGSQSQPEQGGDPQQPAQVQQNAEKAKKAASLVNDAKSQMDLANQTLKAETSAFAESRPFQDEALAKLIEAIQELQPPQQNQDQQQDQQQDEQNQDEGGEQPPEQAEQQDQQAKPGSDESQPPEDGDQKMDPSRILQAVRDREAQRRRDKDKRQPAGRVPVDKDW